MASLIGKFFLQFLEPPGDCGFVFVYQYLNRSFKSERFAIFLDCRLDISCHIWQQFLR